MCLGYLRFAAWAISFVDFRMVRVDLREGKDRPCIGGEACSCRCKWTACGEV